MFSIVTIKYVRESTSSMLIILVDIVKNKFSILHKMLYNLIFNLKYEIKVCCIFHIKIHSVF